MFITFEVSSRFTTPLSSHKHDLSTTSLIDFAIHTLFGMISLLATASSALMVSPGARTAAAYRCGEARMQVAPGTKLLVIGGNGYVGREVCKNAVQLGYAVTSLSRRGECPDANDPFLSQVDWRAGNALDKPTIKAAVGKADAGMPHRARTPG